MQCTVTLRRLRPGTYQAFLAAVEPTYWPQGLERVLVLRNVEDPDEVCTLGWLDMSADALEALRDTPELLAAEAERIQRVAAFADSTAVNAVFEVADELLPPPG